MGTLNPAIPTLPLPAAGTLGLIVRQSQTLQEYRHTLEAMRSFTLSRDTDTSDELWLVQHNPVYTQGQAGRPEHLINTGAIPVVQSDRGGQVTYHASGQLVLYSLLDLRRLEIGVRQMVWLLEECIIQLLSRYNVLAERHPSAPGVYVDKAKIASLGLRIRNGCCYHGIALNVDMDLEPFRGINPCGYAGLEMTQLRDFQPDIAINDVQAELLSQFIELFGYGFSNNQPFKL